MFEADGTPRAWGRGEVHVHEGETTPTHEAWQSMYCNTLTDILYPIVVLG